MTQGPQPQGVYKPAGESALLAMVELAALFHDIGKASKLFQDKMQAVLKNGKPLADAVRHELISAMVLAELVPVDESDSPSLATRLAEVANDPSMIDRAWVKAADLCMHAYKANTKHHEIFTRSGGEKSAALGDPATFRAQLILLVLGHHRLPSGNHKNGTLTSSIHIDSNRLMTRADLGIADGTPFWHESWFIEKLNSSSGNLSDVAPFSSNALDVWARTALMSADHIGSNQNSFSSDLGQIANLKGEPPQRGDTLLKHVDRVTNAAHPMTTGPLRHSWTCPSISEEMTPKAVAMPLLSGSRFDWQVRAANAAADISADGSGGFFATLIAGTGAGKTRGAAAVMAAASLHDYDEDRRGLRYNLALPLRTLASQSGREYVEDLGFSPSDVTTLVGGQAVNWIEPETHVEKSSEENGSQDRFLDEHLIEEVDVTDLSRPLPSLNKVLPHYLQQIVEASNDKGLERFLTTPILSATIDHFMPVAAPLRSFHLAATHRVMTSDLVIDELDLLSEEDISAVKRLVRVAAVAGRRVIIMSATLPTDVAQDFFAVYSNGYAEYAALKGCEARVKYLCAGEAEDALATSANSSSFRSAFVACKDSHATATTRNPVTHLAEILPRATDWPHQVSIIKDKALELHARHAVDIDGVKVSVGLIRMTRIKHLQALAVEMGEANDGCYYAVLHSAMPRLQRENIERGLKRALTRKGDEPQRELRKFLRERNIAQSHDKTDIRIIVLASPVIETGNDVDFDWLIADPSSTRSIIQASGRVNRHRRNLISQPNIAILGDYAVYRQSKPGMREQLMEFPGVETKPSGETDVRRITITVDHAMENLLGQTGSFPIDAKLSNTGNRLSKLEAELQSRFAAVCADDFSNSLFWWMRSAALRHRFRRPTGLKIEAFPIPGDAEKWGSFIGRKRILERIKIQTLPKTHFRGQLVFNESLSELMERVENVRDGRPALCSPLLLTVRGEEEISDNFFVDPHLGCVSKEGGIATINFITLR